MINRDDDRRSFLHSLAGMLFVAARPGRIANGATSVISAERDSLEPWLAGLAGAHRQFFDVSSLAEGRPLNRVSNFLSAYSSSYALPESAISALFGAHGQGLGYVLSDALWKRLELGKLYNITDQSTGKPAIANVYSDTAHGAETVGVNANATVGALMRRGVRFLACRNSINNLAGTLSKRGYGTEGALRDEIIGNLIPGVMPVPAMLLAGNRAQEAGFTYAFLS
jgi:hypothetical protein